MFARSLIAAAALLGLVATGAVATSAVAQTSGAQPTAPAKPMKKSMHTNSMHMKKSMAKEGHKMDNIADKLNACETRPQAERQSCINDASKM